MLELHMLQLQTIAMHGRIAGKRMLIVLKHNVVRAPPFPSAVACRQLLQVVYHSPKVWWALATVLTQPVPLHWQRCTSVHAQFEKVSVIVVSQLVLRFLVRN